MYDVPCHAWPDNLSCKRVLRQHLYSILNKNILSKNRKSYHLHGNPFKIYMTSQNSLHNCHYSKSNKILTRLRLGLSLLLQEAKIVFKTFLIQYAFAAKYWNFLKIIETYPNYLQKKDDSHEYSQAYWSEYFELE